MGPKMATKQTNTHYDIPTTPVFQLKAFLTGPITALNTYTQRESANLEIWQRNWATPEKLITAW